MKAFACQWCWNTLAPNHFGHEKRKGLKIACLADIVLAARLTVTPQLPASAIRLYRIYGIHLLSIPAAGQFPEGIKLS